MVLNDSQFFRFLHFGMVFFLHLLLLFLVNHFLPLFAWIGSYWSVYCWFSILSIEFHIILIFFSSLHILPYSNNELSKWTMRVTIKIWYGFIRQLSVYAVCPMPTPYIGTTQELKWIICFIVWRCVCHYSSLADIALTKKKTENPNHILAMYQRILICWAKCPPRIPSPLHTPYITVLSHRLVLIQFISCVMNE